MKKKEIQEKEEETNFEHQDNDNQSRDYISKIVPFDTSLNLSFGTPSIIKKNPRDVSFTPYHIKQIDAVKTPPKNYDLEINRKLNEEFNKNNEEYDDESERNSIIDEENDIVMDDKDDSTKTIPKEKFSMYNERKFGFNSNESLIKRGNDYHSKLCDDLPDYLYHGYLYSNTRMNYSTQHDNNSNINHENLTQQDLFQSPIQGKNITSADIEPFSDIAKDEIQKKIGLYMKWFLCDKIFHYNEYNRTPPSRMKANVTRLWHLIKQGVHDGESEMIFLLGGQSTGKSLGLHYALRGIDQTLFYLVRIKCDLHDGEDFLEELNQKCLVETGKKRREREKNRSKKKETEERKKLNSEVSHPRAKKKKKVKKKKKFQKRN